MEYLKRFSVLLVVAFILVSLTGCSMFKGDKGDPGTSGDPGDPGVPGAPGTSLLTTYTGTISTYGNYTINIPEILGKPSTTYVFAYYAFSTSPSIWTPMTDGWWNSSYAHIFSVSWTYGKVYLYQMDAGDLYKICVYQNN